MGCPEVIGRFRLVNRKGDDPSVVFQCQAWAGFRVCSDVIRNEWFFTDFEPRVVFDCKSSNRAQDGKPGSTRPGSFLSRPRGCEHPIRKWKYEEVFPDLERDQCRPQ
jgi:hypothetical protein